MAIEEQKAEDLLGLENENTDESADEEDNENDRRFSKRRLRQTQDLLATAHSSEDEDDSSDDSASDVEDKEEDVEEMAVQQEENEHEEKGSDGKDDKEETGDIETATTAGVTQPQDTPNKNADKDKKKKKKKRIKPLTPEELEKFEKEQKRSGVCYLSSIPSYMSPSQLRQHLSKYAEIGRTYMVPQKGEKKKNKLQKFVEGWVEFKDKRKAKALAEYLNMRQVGGKRKNPFYFDTWNIKYLPKFKWHHLTEQMAYERKARQHRLEAEIAQAARENKAYIENVQRSKMIKSMEERRKRKRKETDEEAGSNEEQKIRRTFAQRGKPKQSDVSDLLGNVFGS